MSSLTKPLVLAISLDDSFSEAEAKDRDELNAIFDASQETLQLVYVSHQTSETLIALAAKSELPVPAMFLADTGTTALSGDGTNTIEPLQRNIIQLWPGKEAVTKAMGEVDGVKLNDDDAPCRQSIDLESAETLEAVQAKVNEIGCHLEPHGSNRFDVLPFGVDLGSSLGRWMVQENIAPATVLTFGSAVGDQSLFGRGWRGGIFAGAPDELKEDAGRYHNVHVCDTNGPSAVVDALRHFAWLELSASA